MIFFQVLVNGFILGGLYACVGVGFSLIWGVLSVINLLHGSLIVLGAYIAIFSYNVLDIHPFISIITASAVTGAAGYSVQLMLISQVAEKLVLNTLILTFGLELILDNAMLMTFSANYRQISLNDPLGVAAFFGVFIPLDRLLASVMSFFLIFGVAMFVKLTAFGRAIVALRFDREAALLMGIDVKQTSAMTFALGAALAGAAGSLLCISLPISPLSGPLFLSKAFVVCVLGGVGSISGAALGGLILGVLESFGAMLSEESIH
jgi:branched-chain amino acid transport system permease protein